MRLEPLRRRDIARCVEIEQILFPGDDPWNSRAFHSELDIGHFYLAARPDEGDELLGYAGLAVVGRRRGEYEATVHTIGVAPEYQGQGIGKALLRALLERADADPAVRAVRASIRPDNFGSRATIAGFGFKKIGEQWDPEDGLEDVFLRPAGG